jgi:hypothetical protein
MKLKAVDLVSLLGKSHADDSVKDALAELGLDAAKIKLKRGDVDMNIVSASSGVEIEFADPAKYRGTENLPDGALVLGAVFFSGASGKTLGSLPHRLGFDLTRQTAQSLLGPPSWSSPVAPIDRWSIDHKELTLRFDKATGKVQRVIFSLPK